jgi:hypothetical protein
MPLRSGVCCLAVIFFLTMPAAHAGGAAATTLNIKAFGVSRVEDCRYEISALAAEVPRLRFPSGWTIAIACTPVAWNDSLRKADHPLTTTAFTSIAARITVFNGAIFHDLQTAYQHSIAHELGHIQCGCREESRAESAAYKLLMNLARAEENKKQTSSLPIVAQEH